MFEKNDVPWRLYLAKGDPDVFVDKGLLEQHHIDGIRSMYRMFEKKKPGIILNNHGGTGRTVQTVLFINAIHSLLKQPVLILCTEGREEHWLKQFRASSNFGDGVVIEPNHPLNIKAIVYIHPMHHLSAFCKREWGLLVVDNDNASKEVFRSGIKAHFKIWITSADMKENLETFSQIFKWLYPKDKFCIEEYQANKKSLSDAITKAIMLEAFMEDIVIRRSGASLNVSKKPEVSRKNKDTTGTKIKRTKRKPEINPLPDNDVAPVRDSKRNKARNEDTEFYINVNDIHNINEMGIFAEHKNNIPFDIDNNNSHKNHIREEADGNAMEISYVSDEIEKSIADTNIVEQLLKTSGSELKSNIDNEPKSLSPDIRATEIEKLEADNPKNIKPDKSELNSKHFKENGKVGASVPEFDTQKLLESASVPSQCIVIKYDSDTPGTQVIITQNQDKERSDVSVSEDMFSTDILPHNSEEENKFSEIKNKVHDIETHHNVSVSYDMFSDIPPNENLVHNESNDVEDYKNELDVDSKSNVSENDKTDPKCDTSEDSLDTKMKKLEELTLKKFKGTFLDFMF